MPAEQGATFELPPRADAVRMARRFVAQQVATSTAADLVDDAALVAAELVTNACEHGLPPVTVSVAVVGAQVHLEVRDANPRRPVRPRASTTNMTGRGVALVDQISTRWGVRRDPPGKTVWADLGEIDPGDSPGVDDGSPSWEDEQQGDQELHTVVLGDVPTDLLLEAKAHVDSLVRELNLAEANGASDIEVPVGLAPLVESVVHGFAEARDAIKRQAIAAAERGEPRTRLVLHLPRTTADAAVAYLAGLDEADSYARAARLLTLETPPEHRLFRRWYVGTIIDALRSVDGRLPRVEARPFEDVLVGEIRRLTAAQRATERAARLQRVTAALARARTPEDVAHVVVSEASSRSAPRAVGCSSPDRTAPTWRCPASSGTARHLSTSCATSCWTPSCPRPPPCVPASPCGSSRPPTGTSDSPC